MHTPLYAYFKYNPQYYEPRDLERGETVKEESKITIKKTLEQIELEKTQTHAKLKDDSKTEELTAQEKYKSLENLRKLEDEEKHMLIWESKKQQQNN